MPRHRGASAPEAGQCCTDLQHIHSTTVFSIENDTASQKRVFGWIFSDKKCLFCVQYIAMHIYCDILQCKSIMEE